MNTTAPPLAEDLDGHKGDRMPLRKEGHEHFGFDLEALGFERQTGPSLELQQPKTALRIKELSAGALRELAAHPRVHLSAQPGHCLRVLHAVADNQQCPGLDGAMQKGRYVAGRVLAIAVKGEGPFIALLPCLREAGPERGALAAVPRMPHHRRARRLGCNRCRIRRTVVHDDDEG